MDNAINQLITKNGLLLQFLFDKQKKQIMYIMNFDENKQEEVQLYKVTMNFSTFLFYGIILYNIIDDKNMLQSQKSNSAYFFQKFNDTSSKKQLHPFQFY